MDLWTHVPVVISLIVSFTGLFRVISRLFIACKRKQTTRYQSERRRPESHYKEHRVTFIYSCEKKAQK
jgi:hypothetical protein